MPITSPEQIAESALDRYFDSAGPDTPLNGDEAYAAAKQVIVSAIEADRAARLGGFNSPLAKAVHDALADRGEGIAAEWAREYEGDLLWSRYIGPMLDEIEDRQGDEG